MTCESIPAKAARVTSRSFSVQRSGVKSLRYEYSRASCVLFVLRLLHLAKSKDGFG